MRAIVQHKYGPPEQLSLREVDTPSPKAGEVLVKIHAAGVNDWDLGLLYGKPIFMRLFIGLFRPKIAIIGCEIAGVVEQIGSEVTRFKPGDKVYGDLSDSRFGGYAEFVSVRHDALAHMPSNLSFAQAVAIPHAGLLALQGLRDIAELSQGQSVLINGAGSGVGTLGLQYAKLFKARVAGVDSERKQEYMHLLSFDKVIDYEQEDYTESGIQYDIILDNKSTHSPFKVIKALKPGGIYLSIGGDSWRVTQYALLKKWIFKRYNKRVAVLGLKPNKGLGELTGLVESGKLIPAVDKRYSLEEVPQAIRRFEEAKHCGKIVVLVEPNRRRDDE